MTNESEIYIKPEWGFVARRLNEYRWELQGLHTKISEIEELRYYETASSITPEENKTLQRVRSGMAADLVEQVKAAILANKPLIHGTGFRKSNDAPKNLSEREAFWLAHLDSMISPVNVISELVDSQLNGLGILKGSKAMSKWDSKIRKRKRGESDSDFIDRVNAYKKKWGPPIGHITVHPLGAFFRPGENGLIDEIIEESYKPKISILKQYFKDDEAGLMYKDMQAIPGIPTEYVKSLPVGIDTTNYCKVTEYWNPGWYAVYVNGQEVHIEQDPAVCYFIAPGRTSSSKDPDKFGISVAENLRHNEPLIDRMLTRMVEAAELIVNKRNTLQVPEGYTPEMEDIEGEDGKVSTTKPRTWTFSDEYVEALPAGSQIVDPYKGAEAVYQAMPVVQLLMSVANQHGVSPLFKGISPGAAGSGYRDNSLYLMAKAAFDYVIKSIEACLTAYVEWCEWLLVNHIKQEIFIGELSLSPSDIKDYPATFKVILQPTLPQNLIQEGEFWERQREAGNVTRSYVREHGLGIENPEDMEDEVMFEQLWESMKPYLQMDVMGSVFGKGPLAQQQTDSGLVDSQGKPLTTVPPGPQNNSTTTSGRTATGGSTSGRETAGYASAGVARQPPNTAGSVDSNQGQR